MHNYVTAAPGHHYVVLNRPLGANYCNRIVFWAHKQRMLAISEWVLLLACWEVHRANAYHQRRYLYLFPCFSTSVPRCFGCITSFPHLYRFQTLIYLTFPDLNTYALFPQLCKEILTVQNVCWNGILKIS